MDFALGQVNRELLGKDQRTDRYRDASMVICCILPDKQGACMHTQTHKHSLSSWREPSSYLSHPAGRTAGHNQSRRFLECTEGNMLVLVTGMGKMLSWTCDS